MYIKPAFNTVAHSTIIKALKALVKKQQEQISALLVRVENLKQELSLYKKRKNSGKKAGDQQGELQTDDEHMEKVLLGSFFQGHQIIFSPQQSIKTYLSFYLLTF